MNTIQLIRSARDLMKERGWIQGDFVNAKGQVCALGALREAVRETTGASWDSSKNFTLYNRALSALTKSIRPTVEFPSESTVYTYNDAIGRSREDVLARFNDAIRLVKSGEVTG